MHEGIVPEGLLDESSVFLKTLLDEATTGKVLGSSAVVLERATAAIVTPGTSCTPVRAVTYVGDY